MRHKPIIGILFIFFVLTSCGNNNDKINNEIEKEFSDSISFSNAQFYDYDWDGLVPTESYFINSKIRYLKYKDEPEEGYSTTHVYFNNKTDSIEKYVLRLVSPNNGFWNNKFSDTIYIIYPLRKLCYTYAQNKLVDTTFKEKRIFVDKVKFTYRLKKNTEQQYSITQQRTKHN